MNLKLKTFKLLVIMSLLIFNATASNGHNHEVKHVENKRVQLSKESKSSLIKVLKANEALHLSFFTYDSNLVEKNAKILNDAISEVKDKEIIKLLAFSKKKLSQIKSTSDREANNKNYNIVSMALIYIINKYDVGSQYNAYSCSMVKKKWVQNSEKIAKVHNPYAPEMPHCGSKDTAY